MMAWAKLVIQTYFERANVKFLSTLAVGGLGLDFVHDNGYNLKQIQAGDFDRSKHYTQVLSMVVMYGLQILKLRKISLKHCNNIQNIL